MRKSGSGVYDAKQICSGFIAEAVAVIILMLIGFAVCVMMVGW